MRLGSDQIVACPSCGGLAKYKTLLSGNDIGARVWTDGRQHLPMFPRPPRVVKCRHCRNIYWLSDARHIGQVEPSGEQLLAAPQEWRSAENVQEPDERDYYQAIRANLALNPDEERSLRILAWWRATMRSEMPALFRLQHREMLRSGRKIFERLSVLPD